MVCFAFMLDLLIVGGGPIGLACGIESQKHGLSYRIIEKGVLVNSLYHYPLNMSFFSTSDKLEIGGVPFVSHNVKPTRSEAIEYYRRVAMKFDLNIGLYEALKKIKKEADHYVITTEKGEYKARNVVLATGFYDIENQLNIPGEKLDKVSHYYLDPHPYFRQDLVIVGAKNSAVDAALECWRKGAKSVTMIIREDKISDSVKYWVRPDIINRIEEGSIKAYFNSELKEIKTSTVIFDSPEGQQEIKNDFVLALTGYRPDFSLMEDLGVDLDRDDSMIPSYNESTMESNVSGLYLAGVVCGGLQTRKWFIENSRVHADLITSDIKKKC